MSQSLNILNENKFNEILNTKEDCESYGRVDKLIDICKKVENYCKSYGIEYIMGKTKNTIIMTEEEKEKEKEKKKNEINKFLDELANNLKLEENNHQKENKIKELFRKNFNKNHKKGYARLEAKNE